jgi:hypothetical protein
VAAKIFSLEETGDKWEMEAIHSTVHRGDGAGLSARSDSTTPRDLQRLSSQVTDFAVSGGDPFITLDSQFLDGHPAEV